MFGKYTKTIMAFLATVLGFVGAAATGGIMPTEWVNIAIQTTGAAAVFYAPNVPHANYTKAVLAVLTAGLVTLQTVIVGGVDSGEVYQIVASIFGAIAVYGLANKK